VLLPAQTQSMLHSSWRNTDSEARKGFIMSWMAAEVPCGFVQGRCEGLRSLFPKLRAAVARLQPGREHIVYPLRRVTLSAADPLCIGFLYCGLNADRGSYSPDGAGTPRKNSTTS
jgi:hypothetical protein